MPRLAFFSSLLTATLLAATSVPAQSPAPAAAEEPASKPKADYGYPAAWTPFQLGVLERYQLFSRDTPVRGLRLGLLTAHNDDVSGASLSLVSNYAVEQRGVEAALVNTATSSRGIVVGGVNVTVAPQDESAPSGFGGIGLAALVNSHSGDAAGIQAAGLANHTSGAMSGLQAAAVSCYAGEGASALQLAAIANTSTGPLRGGQLSAIYNYAQNEAVGFQMAGIVNLLEATPPSWQVDAGSGETRLVPAASPAGRTRAVRVAGACNITDVPASIDTISVALGCNLTRGDHLGAQLAAFNKARRTSGLQVGLLNDSEELRGVQIGLFNFRDGRMRWPLVNIGLD